MYRKTFNRNTQGGGRSRFAPRKRFERKGAPIHISKLVNKAVITEEAEHFTPEHSFSDFKIDERLKRIVTTKGYSAPTPIQDRTIPHILHGLDVVGIANTGTGKTAAFLLPLINKVIVNPRENVLIMAPTRELAIQIEDELKTFTKGLKIFSVCCVGGANIGRQIADLRYHNNFIIGTPGRLKDLIQRKVLNLSGFNTVVLDEADRMLDMGFIKDILKEPVRISVKTQDTSKNVDQDVVKVQKGNNKIDVLSHLLTQSDFSKVLIFGRTKHGVERLSRDLASKGFKVDSIHGDKNHSRRQKALGLFKSHHVNILVATDVAARGLDIAGVSHVINYDMPA